MDVLFIILLGVLGLILLTMILGSFSPWKRLKLP